jgi:tetratricopeptide (TPR) repeat protein
MSDEETPDTEARAEADGEPSVKGGEDTTAQADGEPSAEADEETPVEAGGGPPVGAGEGTPVEAGGGPPVGAGEGTPVDVVPLETAEAVAEVQQRRRRLMLYAAALVLVIGLLITMMQVKLGGRSQATPPEVRDWESGMRLIETGKTSKGLAALEELVASLPDGPDRAARHVRLAEIYSRLGQEEPYYLNSAIRHYTDALDFAGRGPWPEGTATVDEVLFETGRCFAALGSHETAVGFYQQLDAEFPDSPLRPQARLAVGECYMAAGHYQQARQVLAEVAEAYRGDPIGEKAFFRFANSFDVQAQALKAEE